MNPVFTPIDRAILVRSAAFWLLLRALDILSTMWCMHRFPDGFEESNPWARNADGTFNVLHGIGVGAVWFVALVLLGTWLYFTLRTVDRKYGTSLAAPVAVAPAWYWSVDTLQATVHNFMTAVGWYHGGW